MLDRELVEEVLRAARRRGGSFAELFVEEKTSTSIRLDDGKVEELTTGLDRGAGVRVCVGTSYGYAYSNRLDRDALLAAAEAASAALREGEPGAVVDLRVIVGSAVNPVERPAERVAGRRQGGVAARGRRRGAFVQPRGHAGRRRLRRFAAARADRDVGRPAGSRSRARGSAWWRRWSPRATGTSRPGSTVRPRAAGSSSSTGIRRAPRPRSPRAAPSRCWTRSRRRRGR